MFATNPIPVKTPPKKRVVYVSAYLNGVTKRRMSLEIEPAHRAARNGLQRPAVIPSRPDIEIIRPDDNDDPAQIIPANDVTLDDLDAIPLPNDNDGQPVDLGTLIKRPWIDDGDIARALDAEWWTCEDDDGMDAEEDYWATVRLDDQRDEYGWPSRCDLH